DAVQQSPDPSQLDLALDESVPDHHGQAYAPRTNPTIVSAAARRPRRGRFLTPSAAEDATPSADAAHGSPVDSQPVTRFCRSEEVKHDGDTQGTAPRAHRGHRGRVRYRTLRAHTRTARGPAAARHQPGGAGDAGAGRCVAAREDH